MPHAIMIQHSRPSQVRECQRPALPASRDIRRHLPSNPTLYKAQLSVVTFYINGWLCLSAHPQNEINVADPIPISWHDTDSPLSVWMNGGS